MFRMPDQRSTTDQLHSLASICDEEDLPEVGRWLRSLGAEGSIEPRLCDLLIRKANLNSLYDAADWVRSWRENH